MIFDCRDEAQRRDGVEAARAAVRAGELAVIPTDTVYGLAADAFSPAAVQRLLDAKGRDRTMPPPVLIGATSTLEALVAEVPGWLREMTGELWPGALTVVCHQQASLDWDLGETHRTVAVRVPDDEIARELLSATGPLAVSSANLTGRPAATTAAEAEEQLGESVSVYLDGGPSGGGVPSTILDVTGPTPRILRQGAVDLEVLHRFNNTIEPAPSSGGSSGA
ncbi:L-threonylcarbamoyladenylate synthase [Aeromicrobium sp. Leaf350]|uniref:L-threonylcarbamoyladenylate synthase n=1 Tax=Aeromicrobium sp. Leaf350 TaxID=2876565 RepID=UPI001E4FC89C|nr:L-threonylcarbamoyladenylate synthase [Aeromicrobium sp. Leaf350]